jgi:hypothetical protein
VFESAHAPDDIAVDSNGVYFASSGMNDAGIMNVSQVYACGLTSCATPKLLYSSAAITDLAGSGSISASGGALYLSYTGSSATPFGIERVSESTGGSTYTTLAGSALGSGYTITTDAHNAYYASNTVVYGSPLTPVPATPSVIMSGLTAVTRIAVDAHYVYAADSGGNRVVACPIVAGVPSACGSTGYTTVASGLPAPPSAIFSDGTNVWFGGYGGGTGSIYKCSIGNLPCGSPPAPFATGSPYDLLADANHVYWADGKTPGVFRCPAAAPSCATPTLLVSGNPVQLAQTPTTVYWTDFSSLYALPK